MHDTIAPSSTATIRPRGSDLDHLRWMKESGWTAGLAGKLAVDLGCGSGHVCQSLTEMGCKAIGLDLEPLPSGNPRNWQFLTGNLNTNDWIAHVQQAAGPQRVQLLLAFDIIEHLRAPIAFAESCFQLLTPGGRLVLTTPNVNSWERILRPNTWSGSQDPQHLVLFTRYSLGFLLRKAGFVDVGIDAPMRALESLPRWLRLPIGAQILATARRP